MIRAFFVCALLLAALISTVVAESSAKIGVLLQSARSQMDRTVGYDGSYRSIPYPGGDVPTESGVCTDVVIRAYRDTGVDLQKLLHEDLKLHFSAYPSAKIWGLTRPDPNIDHRRVPNLEVFFKRHGQVFSTDLKRDPAQPGDLLTWLLPGNLPHIGIVSDRRDSDGTGYLVIHNIGQGTSEEEVIGRFQLTGHFRYLPWDGLGMNGQPGLATP